MRKLGKTENIRKHIICDTPFNFIRDLPCVSLVSLTSPADIALLSQAKPSPSIGILFYLSTHGRTGSSVQAGEAWTIPSLARERCAHVPSVRTTLTLASENTVCQPMSEISPKSCCTNNRRTRRAIFHNQLQATIIHRCMIGGMAMTI